MLQYQTWVLDIDRISPRGLSYYLEGSIQSQVFKTTLATLTSWLRVQCGIAIVVHFSQVVRRSLQVWPAYKFQVLRGNPAWSTVNDQIHEHKIDGLALELRARHLHGVC